MAKGVNKVILVGNLADVPEVRYTPNGVAVANASIATSESWNDQQGQKKERTEWHRLVFYRRLAEVIGEYGQKGMKIYVEGKLKTREWTDQQGVKRYTTEILVNEMQMLNNPSGVNQQSNNYAGANNAGQQQGNATRGQQNNAPRTNQPQGNNGGYAAARNQPMNNQPQYQEPPMDFDDDIPFARLFLQYPELAYAS